MAGLDWARHGMTSKWNGFEGLEVKSKIQHLEKDWTLWRPLVERQQLGDLDNRQLR
jgi:hypothetical protein